MIIIETVHSTHDIEKAEKNVKRRTMSNLAIKIYKPDYSFIIKNYLDQSQWGKEYTIYQYKNFTAKIYLKDIKVISKELIFDVESNEVISTIKFSLLNKHHTVEILKNQINGAVRSGLKTYFGKLNYQETYSKLYDNYTDKHCLFEDDIDDKVNEIWDNIPEIAKRVIDYDDMVDYIIKSTIGTPPSIYDYEEEHYIQELNIFNGIQDYVDNQPAGEIEIPKELLLAIQYTEDESSMTEEEKDIAIDYLDETREEIDNITEDEIVDNLI